MDNYYPYPSLLLKQRRKTQDEDDDKVAQVTVFGGGSNNNAATTASTGTTAAQDVTHLPTDDLSSSSSYYYETVFHEMNLAYRMFPPGLGALTPAFYAVVAVYELMTCPAVYRRNLLGQQKKEKKEKKQGDVQRETEAIPESHPPKLVKRKHHHRKQAAPAAVAPADEDHDVHNKDENDESDKCIISNLRYTVRHYHRSPVKSRYSHHRKLPLMGERESNTCDNTSHHGGIARGGGVSLHGLNFISS